MKLLGLAFVAACALATSAQAATVVNGSFETGASISGGFDLLAPGDAGSIAGWTVLGPGGVDYVDNSLWDAQQGSRSVELAGLSPGGVSQDLVNQFIPGELYRLSFWLSANPFADDGDYSAVVSATDAFAETFMYSKTAANSATNMLYEQYFYDWTPLGVNSTITFAATGSGPLGVILDNVSVSAVNAQAVPEPSTWALLLAGLGMIVFANRRRRDAVPACSVARAGLI